MHEDFQLGYVGFEVSALAAWRSFATDVVGLTVGDDPGADAFALRMDGAARRLILHPGASDDLSYVGFEARDLPSLESWVGRLRAAGLNVTDASSDVASVRAAERVYQIRDPNGVLVELCAGLRRANTRFDSPLVKSGFVTGDEGLGHIVLNAPEADPMRKFYIDHLGMRLSDHINQQMSPDFELRATFLHSNPRHHTLAFAEMPSPKRMHHFMLEMNAIDDVGLAYDRCLAAGVPIASNLGRHPNDEMFSFYAVTPSQFQIEIGWGGRKVDDASWEVRTYDRVSVWGHQSPPAPPDS